MFGFGEPSPYWFHRRWILSYCCPTTKLLVNTKNGICMLGITTLATRRSWRYTILQFDPRRQHGFWIWTLHRMAHLVALLFVDSSSYVSCACVLRATKPLDLNCFVKVSLCLMSFNYRTAIIFWIRSRVERRWMVVVNLWIKKCSGTSHSMLHPETTWGRHNGSQSLLTPSLSQTLPLLRLAVIVLGVGRPHFQWSTAMMNRNDDGASRSIVSWRWHIGISSRNIDSV